MRESGHVNLSSLKRILDPKPPVKDPNAVIPELAAASSRMPICAISIPSIRSSASSQGAGQGARPVRTRDRDRSGAQDQPAGDQGNAERSASTIRTSRCLRRRLKVPAEGGAPETVFDDKLELALKAYQVEKGIKASGQLSGATRVSLNKEGEARRAPDPERGHAAHRAQHGTLAVAAREPRAASTSGTTFPSTRRALSRATRCCSGSASSSGCRSGRRRSSPSR